MEEGWKDATEKAMAPIVNNCKVKVPYILIMYLDACI